MDKIMEYLIDERDNSEVSARLILRSLSKYNDIMEEFSNWINSRIYPKQNAISVEGYTARDISQIAPFMDGAGVYSFLVTLRDEPVKAKEIMRNGFRRK